MLAKSIMDDSANLAFTTTRDCLGIVVIEIELHAVFLGLLSKLNKKPEPKQKFINAGLFQCVVG